MKNEALEYSEKTLLTHTSQLFCVNLMNGQDYLQFCIKSLNKAAVGLVFCGQWSIPHSLLGSAEFLGVSFLKEELNGEIAIDVFW